MEGLNHVRNLLKQKIGGMDDIIDKILDEIVAVLSPQDSSFPIPTFLLLTGGVGSGKSFLIKEIVKALSIPYLFIKCSSIVQTMIGESELCLKNMFQFSKQHEESILIFDDLDILVPNESTITSMVQYRLSSLFIDKMNEIYLTKRRCVVIGIVNQVQLSQLHPSLCCSTMMKSIITIPKLDKQRRLAILQKCLPSQYEESFYLQLAEETSSYSTADLHSFCSYCLQHPQQELILQQLNQQNSSIARQFHSVIPLQDGFTSLYGMNSIKKQVIENIISPLLHWEKYTSFHLQPPSGCLFYGPSGCGKTAMIQALAFELRNRVEIIEISCTDLLSKYLGDSEKKLHGIFTLARQSTPCIIVFDHIEVITAIRGNDASEEKTMDRLLSCLLTEIDGIYGSKKERVFMIGITEHLEMIDSSILRSGRLECHIAFSKPIPSERREMICAMMKDLTVVNDEEKNLIIEWIVNKTSFKSHADVKGFMEKIIMKVITEGISPLTKEYVFSHFLIVCLI